MSKIVPKLQTAKGEIINDQKKIMNVIELFYKNLYSSKEKDHVDTDLNTNLNKYNTPKLNDDESEKLEGFLTLSELTTALKDMKNNRSPGVDGFSCKFFEVVWKQLSSFVLRGINYSYNIGELSVSQQEGIITLLPKENKSRLLLTNYNQICLLSTIYKLASAGIANRLKTVITKLKNTVQSGFISGRYIGENTRLVYDLMQFAEEKNMSVLLLLVDLRRHLIVCHEYLFIKY